MTMASAGFDPWDLATAGALALSALLYSTGLIRLWRQSGQLRALGPLQVLAFHAGLGSLVVALLSPLDTLSEVLFSAHMGQHELLMLVSAPLLVMGRPAITALWALPPPLRHRLALQIRRPGLLRIWRALTGPFTVVLLHAVALWIWHVPWFFESALHSENIHAAQHLCFFLSAGLFWWALVSGRYGRSGYGAAVLFVFVTSLHSGLLGAMITFAEGLWYPTHQARTRALGIDPLQDQQLAGLLMWIPAGVILMVLGLGFLAAWLGHVQRRALVRPPGG
jgi:putative membrane protein